MVTPVAPEVAREIAKDAFLTGLFYDGEELRLIKRYSRSRPREVAIALELGEPPSFDGVACVDCGNRFRTEFDHVHPRAALGPNSYENNDPRCWPCHQAKTERDRRAGLLKPPEP
jgi:5-methylcytosine-specific restriction endonuclease McrA